jgi:tetratricopeptide (TPR) repeat protein
MKNMVRFIAGWSMRIMLSTMWIGMHLHMSAADFNYQQLADKQVLYRDLLKKGDKYMAEKNYAAAMFEYEKASELMPDEDEPKLKMQSIEATLGIKELAEVKRKVELARKQEQEKLRKAAQEEASSGKADINAFIRDRQIQSEKDSIRKAIFDQFAEELRTTEKGNDMLARSQVYRKIADAFRKAKDEEIALTYYKKALEIEEKFGKQSDVSVVYQEIADVYYTAGDFQNSILSYEKSLSMKQKAGDKTGASNIMSFIANVYETTYDYKNAIDYYQKSAKLKDSIKDEAGLKDVMNNLGDVYYKQKILTSSILSYEKTVGIIRKLDMKEALGPVYNKLGVAHYEMGNYSEAEKFFNESMKNLYENGNRKEAAMALNNLGNLLYINNKYGDAISYYERSLAAKKETGYDYGRAVTLFNLGNAYRRSGNQEKALEIYAQSLRIADSLDITSLNVKNLKAMASSYEAAKKFEMAADLQDQLNAMEAGTIGIEIPISENEMDLDIEKTQEILSKLNEEALKRKDLAEHQADKKMTDMFINNLNTRYLKEQHKSRFYFILTISLAGLLVVVLLLYRHAAWKRKMQS